MYMLIISLQVAYGTDVGFMARQETWCLPFCGEGATSCKLMTNGLGIKCTCDNVTGFGPGTDGICHARDECSNDPCLASSTTCVSGPGYHSCLCQSDGGCEHEECTVAGRRCSGPDTTDGMCTLTYANNLAGDLECMANYTGGSDYTPDQSTETIDVLARLRSEKRALRLPAHTGKAFAVLVMCGEHSPPLVEQILKAGGRVVLFGNVTGALLTPHNEHDESTCNITANRLAAEHALPDVPLKHRFEFIETLAKTNNRYIGHYAPFFVLEDGDGWTRMWMQNYQYFDNRLAKDWFPVRLAHYTRKSVLMNTLRNTAIEGSNVLSNGKGKCIVGMNVVCQNTGLLCKNTGAGEKYVDPFGSHARVVPPVEANGWGPLDADLPHSGDVDMLRQLLAEHWGCTDIAFMQGLPGDNMDHVDTYYMWLNENTVAMGIYDEHNWNPTHTYNKTEWVIGSSSAFRPRCSDDTSEPFCEYKQRRAANEEALAKLGVYVEIIHMPRLLANIDDKIPYIETHLGGIVVTDLNTANRTLIMPTFGTPTITAILEEATELRQKYEALYKKYFESVVLLDATQLLRGRGTLHGATSFVPYVDVGSVCDAKSTLREYVRCLEEMIPQEVQEELRKEEFDAEVALRNKLTQKTWQCSRKTDGTNALECVTAS